MAVNIAAKIAQSASAQAKIKAAVAKRMDEYTDHLVSCTESVAPSHGSIDFTGSPTGVSVSGKGLRFTAESGVDYDHDGAMRETMSALKSYPVQDMIMNFDLGWHARAQIVEGDMKSRVSYEGDHFAEGAASMFNATTPAGVTATVTMGGR